jgi:hypothetical protein
MSAVICASKRNDRPIYGPFPLQILPAKGDLSALFPLSTGPYSKRKCVIIISTSSNKSEQLLEWLKNNTSEQKHLEPGQRKKKLSKKKKRDAKLAAKGIVREFETAASSSTYPQETPTRKGVIHVIKKNI